MIAANTNAFRNAGVVLVAASSVPFVVQTEEIFLIAAAIGAAVAFALLTVMVIDPKTMRFSRIFGTILLFPYAAGSVVTWIQALSPNDLAAIVEGRPWTELSIALGVVYLACGFALILGEYDIPCFKPVAVETSGPFTLFLATLGIGLIVTAYLTGGMGYQGVQTNEVGTASIIGAIATATAPPLLGLLGYQIGRTKSLVVATAPALLAFPLLLAVIPIGRRDLVEGMVIFAVGFALSGQLLRWSIVKRCAAGSGPVCRDFVSGRQFFLQPAFGHLGAWLRFIVSLATAVGGRIHDVANSGRTPPGIRQYHPARPRVLYRLPV
jgi:hypothetical protein